MGVVLPQSGRGFKIFVRNCTIGTPFRKSWIRHCSAASEQQPTIQQDDVYFDHLVSGPPTVPGKTVQASVPEPQQGGGGGGGEEDQVYFDHLTSPPPVKPSQSVSAPKLPPRRPSSASSDMKPSNGAKKPVSTHKLSLSLSVKDSDSMQPITATFSLLQRMEKSILRKCVFW